MYLKKKKKKEGFFSEAGEPEISFASPSLLILSQECGNSATAHRKDTH